VFCGERGIVVWDFHDLEDRPRNLVSTDKQINSCDFSPDGNILASSAGLIEGKGGVIHLWDFTNFQADPILLKGHSNTIETVVFSPEGRYLASSGLFRDKTIRIWDISKPDAYSFTIRGTEPSVLSFSHDGKLLASTDDGIIYLWDMSKVLGEFNP